VDEGLVKVAEIEEVERKGRCVAKLKFWEMSVAEVVIVVASVFDAGVRFGTV
jgi:hypothetical protein